jgi:hypothetical protein
MTAIPFGGDGEKRQRGKQSAEEFERSYKREWFSNYFILHFQKSFLPLTPQIKYAFF